MYGAFRDSNDFLYDPYCTYRTTINLQLCLIMLIEELELNGINVVSANTDGIVCKIPYHLEDTYYTVTKNNSAENLKTKFVDDIIIYVMLGKLNLVLNLNIQIMKDI